MKPLNIIYMGTPDFAVKPLEALYQSAHNIIAVYTQPPRPSGRGKKIQKSDVHIWADVHDIPVYHPKSLKKNPAQQEFAALNADLAVVAAYGLILPKFILDAPKHGCMNIHGSLLPRWRGASPIQHAIWKGDTTSGVTIMQMDEGLDTGDMLYIESCAITQSTTSPSLYDEISNLGAKLVVTAANDLAQGQLAKAQKQDDALSNYAPMLKKEDGLIDWSDAAQDIDRQIRALNPWPSTFVMRDNGERMKILAGSVLAQSDIDLLLQNNPALDLDEMACGTLLTKKGHILCGHKTIYQISNLQPQGKKEMDVASAINGGYLTL